MRRGSAVRTGCAVLFALVVAGCGHSSAPVSDVVVSPDSKVPHRPTPLMAVQAPLPLTPDEEVARVGLRSAEIPSAQRVRWPAEGRQLDGPELTFCAATSSTDGHRAARRTVTGTVPYSRVLFADQAVAYDSEATARLALRHVRRSADACAVSPIRVTCGPGTLPVATSYVLSFQVAQPRGTLYVSLAAQQRGDVVDVMSVTSPRSVTPRQQRLLLREAGYTGKRLARLPLASTGA